MCTKQQQVFTFLPSTPVAVPVTAALALLETDSQPMTSVWPDLAQALLTSRISKAPIAPVIVRVH